MPFLRAQSIDKSLLGLAFAWAGRCFSSRLAQRLSTGVLRLKGAKRNKEKKKEEGIFFIYLTEAELLSSTNLVLRRIFRTEGKTLGTSHWVPGMKYVTLTLARVRTKYGVGHGPPHGVGHGVGVVNFPKKKKKRKFNNF